MKENRPHLPDSPTVGAFGESWLLTYFNLELYLCHMLLTDYMLLREDVPDLNCSGFLIFFVTK